MANSSDWIAALAGAAPTTGSETPAWIAALGGQETFVAGFPASSKPVGSPPVDPVPPRISPDPVQAPDAEAVAFAKGEASGRAAAETEHRAVLEVQRSLRLNFRALDQAAMDSLAGDLSQTVIALCKAAIADFTPDADTLLQRCHDAARRIGHAAAECTLHLHPQDIALIAPETLEHWRIAADVGVERGGLRFEGPDGAISDGPAEWCRAIAVAIRG